MEPTPPVLLVRLDATGGVVHDNVDAVDPARFGGDPGGIVRALAGRRAELDVERLAWQAGGRSLVTAVAALDGDDVVTATLDVTGLPAAPATVAGGVDRETGLADRSGIVERLAAVVRRVGRGAGQAAVAVVELADGTPDDGVALAADALEEATRAGDVIGRIAPTQLAIVFGSAIGEVEARLVAGRVVRALGPVHVGVTFTAVPRAAALLLDEAIAAVELARAAGTSVYVVDDEDRVELEWSTRRVAELRLALELGQLEVHHQPVVDLLTGETRSVEALVRWRHPDDGLVGPEAFVPLAERTGLMPQLTAAVLDQVLTWLAATPGAPPVGVNVSATDLLSEGFATALLDRLGRAGVSPEQLRLELTETALLADPPAASRVIGELRAAGVGVSLDDFGTGLSSLAVLTSLPVDCLKIDLAFVAGLPDSAADVAVARLVVGLGRELGLDVVAEGVQTEAQRLALVELGCRLGQGFLFARPERPPA